jgi:hypothetical protein
MEQYFNIKTGEEVVLNKPFKTSISVDGYTTSFETSCLSQPMADMLVKNGLLSNKKPNAVPTEFNYYVHKLAKKLKVSYEDCCTILQCLEEYAPATVFSLLAKQIALELDNKYDGHIGKSKELFGVELTTGCIIPITIKPTSSLKNVALFRSVDDTMFAINILKPIYNRMYQ